MWQSLLVVQAVDCQRHTSQTRQHFASFKPLTSCQQQSYCMHLLLRQHAVIHAAVVAAVAICAYRSWLILLIASQQLTCLPRMESQPAPDLAQSHHQGTCTATWTQSMQNLSLRNWDMCTLLGSTLSWFKCAPMLRICMSWAQASQTSNALGAFYPAAASMNLCVIQDACLQLFKQRALPVALGAVHTFQCVSKLEPSCRAGCTAQHNTTSAAAVILASIAGSPSWLDC